MQKLLFPILILILSNISLAVSDCVTVYKMDKGMCGELCLSSYISEFAIKFGGVTKGNCKDINFTIFDHKESISVGPFGNFEVTVYKKSELALKFLGNEKKSLVDNVLLGSGSDVTVYKITDGLCGELHVSCNVVYFEN